MKRLSRGARLLRVALPFLIALYLAMAALSIHVLVIDRRMIVQEGFTQSCRRLLEVDQIAGWNLCDLLRL